MHIPMRDKYVDERTGIWFIFGKSLDGKSADVSDHNGDIFDGIPYDVAVKVCEAQAEFRETLYKLLCYGNRGD